jgi:molybdate-binding protein/DNA-binding transcriptional ArsR family regulator
MTPASDVALFKVLGHPERYALLRRLMAGQATLSQLGAAFRKTPAHIRHHLKVLEAAGLVEFAEARPVQGGPEKYYRATQRALFIHQAVLPEIPARQVGLTIGSMDAGLQQLAGRLGSQTTGLRIIPLPLSSLDGLIAMRQGLCQMSTCHLLDPLTEEYNRSFVRHLFPSQPMALVQVFRRQEGLMVKAGNPKQVRSLADLARPKVRFVNREPGSGVRQWLDVRLKQLGVPIESIHGYHTVVASHQAVAQAIQRGQADTGLGIAASARALGLDFIPLYEEPYELAMPMRAVADRRFAPLFDYLNSGEFRAAVRALDGYVVPQNAGAVEVVG